MKRYKLLLLILLFLIKASAQDISIIYKGGSCIESNICGYWILKKDASFIYANVDSFGLNSFGFGKWKIEKDQLFVEFDSSVNKIKPLMNYSITSKSKSDYSNPDSIKIIVKVVDKAKNLIRDKFISVNNKILIKENKDGNTVFILPRSTPILKIQIGSPFFDFTPIINITDRYNNHFEFIVTIEIDKFEYSGLHKTALDYTELINDRYYNVTSTFKESVGLIHRFRILKPKEVRIHDFTVAESEERIQDIINKLRKVQKLQPQNYSSINQIVSLIKD